MIFCKDTQKMEDANEFGEALRKYCFISDKYGGTYGCYSTFELRPEFKKIEMNSNIGKDLLLYLGLNEDGSCGEGDWKQTFHPSLFSNGEIHLGWYWDGDGTLVIHEGNKIVYNSDCKKDYVWKWIGDS